jgi:hypothetical protein
MGKLKSANLHLVLPPFVNKSIVNALKHFSKSIPGLIEDDALLVGIETRTSSPVRIERDSQSLESTNTIGLYPLGEGAGINVYNLFIYQIKILFLILFIFIEHNRLCWRYHDSMRRWSKSSRSNDIKKKWFFTRY